ncbi:MAG: chloride channel protein [Ignavibacteria bacterium]|nr:chloride channel protein [Ignavibacteriales bacterium]
MLLKKDNSIPVAVSLTSTFQKENLSDKKKYNKKQLFKLSAIAVLIAVAVSLVARLLVHLIDLITNIAFYGNISIEPSNPANNLIGWPVVFIPVIGGLIVGLMAMYGSKAIRGHGIPEAMEQILTNQSRIKPSVTFLKPISSAICIGTGGPFGAEGPIIATGGALGSAVGQVLSITPNERKILLASGATAGMAAIFGSPVAAILLAIELLLFEFSPRSFVPVALACITGAAGYHVLFGEGVVFSMPEIVESASNYALFFYSVIGLVIGLLSIAATKIVYWIEDMFEKLPVHWAWWPAIGSLAVGMIGYYQPRTLGVGYNNITDILSGSLSVHLMISLCVLKFLSWAVSLGSGTSGGTLAPLLTIGGSVGALSGYLGLNWFPDAGISIPLSALVGMSAMFAGASRAFLTSIVFALETTGQVNAFLPLLATCTGSYFVSYFLMDNTIMTEKIARRGIITPYSYEPDILEKTKVSQIISDDGIVISSSMKTGEVRNWLEQESDLMSNYFVIADTDSKYVGLLSSSNLFSSIHPADTEVGELVKRKNIFVHPEDSLKRVVETMARENVDLLPILSENKIIGILSYGHILSVYKDVLDENEKKQSHISLTRQSLRILVKGQKLIALIKKKNSNQ